VSGFRKEPVAGRVRVLRTGLEGDGVGDPRVHGGPCKTVYAYPEEHYEYWRRERPELAFAPGAFGENLTVAGILEMAVGPGDTLRIGTARLVVTQPRFPCFKLGLRHDRPRLVKEFARSGRSGFYLSVEQEGELGAGDPIDHRPAPGERPTIRAMFAEKVDVE
jgi:MOSC domain-containing protein YiiM